MTTKQLEKILGALLDGSFQAFDEEPTLFNKDFAEMIDETAKNRGLTQKEAFGVAYERGAGRNCRRRKEIQGTRQSMWHADD